MTAKRALAPAKELALKSAVRFPGESDEYRRARDALLVEEIELRRHIERVAEQRRRLQGDPRRVQLHVRAPARATLPDVHLADERLGRPLEYPSP